MKVISKKISYDSLVSRIPGVIPSIMDSWKVNSLIGCTNATQAETYYSYSKAVERASEYNIRQSNVFYNAEFVTFDKNNLREFSIGNYGLIPSDIIVPSNISESITDYTDIYVNLPNENGGFYDLSWPKNEGDPHYDGRKIISGGTEIKVLTYYTLNKWYTFFKKYHELIGNHETAIDYYNATYNIKDAETEKEFSEMDKLYASRGGKDMYEWITDNCIIQYNIPNEYVNEWNTTFLYFPQAIQWYWWFKERVDKYEGITFLEDCTSTNDCYDCKEFLRLGGIGFFNKLSQWLDNVNNFKPSFATKSASIVIPLNITNSIDDLGEMTIFSNEWQEEVDYHNTLNDNAGTVVNQPYEMKDGEMVGIDETFVIRNSLTKGYEYNIYKEDAFKQSDWENYTDYYMNHNTKEFVSSVSSYTYSPVNGKVLYNPEKIYENIPIINEEVSCINGELYNVIDGKYVKICYADNYIASVKYKKNMKLQVFKDGDLDYAMMNGKRVYAEIDKNGREKIYFLKNVVPYDEGCYVNSWKYIIFNNILYLLESDYKSVKIDDDTYKKTYPILEGYIEYRGNTLYISGNTVVIPDSFEYIEDSDNYLYRFRELNEEELASFGIKEITVKYNNVKIEYNFEEKVCNTISGYSDSKLELIRRKEITTDDFGNELPGHFKSVVDIPMIENEVDTIAASKMSHYNLPYDECVLDILYKVGDVSGLEPLDASVFGEDAYHGNIITNIEFYYCDAFKNHKISIMANDDNALDAIKQCEELFKTSDDESIVNQMLCDITYYIGATIRKNNKTYSLADDLHCGVKYIDTVFVNKKTGVYNMWSNKKFTYTYYSLEQNISSVYLSDFKDSIISSVSYFEFKPLLYKNTQDGVVPYDEQLFNGWTNHNDTIIAPLFRTEFNLGTSYPQNVDANIYIDRGINSAFEKHLKLQEIKTMDALIDYGLSYFKINNY